MKTTLGLIGVLMMLTPIIASKLAVEDPVQDFIIRVDVNAMKSELWKSNYTLAHYRAFMEESQKETKRLGPGAHQKWEKALSDANSGTGSFQIK